MAGMTRHGKIASAVAISVFAIGLATMIFGAVKTYEAIPQGSLFSGVTVRCPFVTASYTPGQSFRHDCYTSYPGDTDDRDDAYCQETHGRCYQQLFTLGLNCTRDGITKLFEITCLAACNNGPGRLVAFMNSAVFPKAPYYYDDGRDNSHRDGSVAGVVLGGLVVVSLISLLAYCFTPQSICPQSRAASSESASLLALPPKPSLAVRAANAFREILPCCRRSDARAKPDVAGHPIYDRLPASASASAPV